MEGTHKLITIDNISSVTTGYWAQNLQISFGLSITHTLGYAWYKMTCVVFEEF